MKKKPASVPAKDGRANGYIERLIERLRRSGCQFPASRRELLFHPKVDVSERMIRRLAQRGLVVLSEGWDGSLMPTTAKTLEYAGITSRADFREKYLAGTLDVLRWPLYGKNGRARLFAWAGLPMPDSLRPKVSLALSGKTCEALDALVKKRGLHSREELVSRLVAEAG